MDETTDSITGAILTGVGGQGVILASGLLALAAANAGHDTKQTEVHGIAQRGGSVHSHVRFGTRVYSPLIKPGQADVLIATEKLEGLRFAHYVRRDGLIVMNTHELPPIGSGESYPHGAVDFLRGQGFRVVAFNSTERAGILGNRRVSNVILLGAASPNLGIPNDIWLETIENRLPPEIVEINRKAFAEGRRSARDEYPHAESMP